MRLTPGVPTQNRRLAHLALSPGFLPILECCVPSLLGRVKARHSYVFTHSRPRGAEAVALSGALVGPNTRQKRPPLRRSGPRNLHPLSFPGSMTRGASRSMARARVEACVESLESARAAEEGGAHCLELCAALSEGGLTPSYGLISEVAKAVKTPVRVLIRPRPGDFVYSQEELVVMLADIESCAALGVEGVVIGALTALGDIDVPKTLQLAAWACERGLEVTFHRAFDHTREPLAALQALLGIPGVSRLLTSGQKRSAREGAPLIAELVEAAGTRIQVMAGGGVSSSNAADIVRSTACPWVHGSFRRAKQRPAPVFHNPDCPLGISGSSEALFTDVKEVQAVVEAVAALQA